MMAEVFADRYTVRVEKPVVLFLIGMRFNNLLAVQKWLPVTLAMSRVLAELATRPEAGPLFHRRYISGRVLLVQQYWESFDKLLAYAHDRSGQHFFPPGGLQPRHWNRWVGRHLARDVSRRAGEKRVHLCQHAAIRFGRGHRSRQSGRTAGGGQGSPKGSARGSVSCVIRDDRATSRYAGLIDSNRAQTT
jgi:hypothetical protein